MNSDIQQSGSFRRYSERLLPCRSSTEYPRLAKGNLFFRNTKTVKQKGISRLSRLSPIQTRSGHDTHKVAPVYAPQSFPDTCAVTVRHAFMDPPRPAHHADYTLSRTLAGGVSYGVQAHAAYRLLVNRMFTRCRRHTCQQHAGYNSASRLIRTRHIPDARIMRLCFRTDACSFVRHYLRRPAYVSYRRSASYCTAGEGRCPFEPRKAQRQGKR